MQQEKEIIHVSHFLAGQASHGLEELKKEFENLNAKQIRFRDPLREYHQDLFHQDQKHKPLN